MSLRGLFNLGKQRASHIYVTVCMPVVELCLQFVFQHLHKRPCLLGADSVVIHGWHDTVFLQENQARARWSQNGGDRTMATYLQALASSSEEPEDLTWRMREGGTNQCVIQFETRMDQAQKGYGQRGVIPCLVGKLHTIGYFSPRLTRGYKN